MSNETMMLDILLADARRGCYCEQYRKPCSYHEGYADALDVVLRVQDDDDMSDMDYDRLRDAQNHDS